MYKAHRRAIALKVRQEGIRECARRAGVNPMIVSRFVAGTGGDDGGTLYALADAVGFKIRLWAGPEKKNT